MSPFHRSIHLILLMNGSENVFKSERGWSGGRFWNVRDRRSSIQLFLHLVRGSNRWFVMNRSMALGGCKIEKPIGLVLRIYTVPAGKNNVRINNVPYHRMKFAIIP